MGKKKKVSLPLKIFVVIFCLYASIQLVGLQIKINAQKQEKENLQQQVEQRKTENAQLEDLANSEIGENDEYIASIAREKFGYGYSGEQIFVDISSQ